MIGSYTMTSTEVFSAASAGRLTDAVEDTELSSQGSSQLPELLLLLLEFKIFIHSALGIIR